ncbi:hypothetical protein ACFWP3_02875 [Streptomyces sp. NPDC058525]|uniref:hypothetical protein n=1 Tax=Streptomyces sp. NPDC058525 TaxID=3346538 RepID=UPI0036530244
MQSYRRKAVGAIGFGDQSRASFGVGIEDGTFLAAFTAEEVRAASAIAGEPLKRGARGEVHFLDVIASVKVKVTRPASPRAASPGEATHSDARSV